MSLDFARIGFLEVQAPVPFDQFVGNFDLAIDHVAMNLDVAGPLLGPDGAHDAMQFECGGARLGQHRRRAGDFLIDAMLRFYFAGLMMDQRSEFAFLLAGAAGENQNRHALGERSRNRIHHVVTAGAVGHADHADSSGRARVTVGSESDAGFMR